MTWILASLLTLFLGGGISYLCGRHERASAAVSLLSVLSAAVMGMVPAAFALVGDRNLEISRPWAMPLGAFALGLDGLSALFVLPMLFLAAVAALAGVGSYAGGESAQSPGLSRFFFHLLVAGMLLVVLARNALLFLFAWEIMSVASFFLVVREDARADVRRAGWIYLVATHAGTACLLVMFLLLGQGAATLGFAGAPLGGSFSRASGAIFLLALLGFGTKAGFVPLHTWLPEAHPAAPSHVSALMSGVMIKMGIYGLARVLIALGPPPLWYGWTLLAIGIASGLFGVLFALVQPDLKRLLAYSSVENVGLISIGLGLGLIGRSLELPAVSVLGFGGALLHVVNHAILKGLLFLSAGSAVHAVHTHRLDAMGGLLRRMPWTGGAFLTGAVGLCGLPPLNGFLSELLLYLSAFTAVLSPGSTAAIAGLCAVAALALIGGLAAACFSQAFGIVFLGAARGEAAARAAEAPRAGRIAMGLLMFAGLALALSAFALPRLLRRPIEQLSQLPPATLAHALEGIARPLAAVSFSAGALLAVTLILALGRRTLVARRGLVRPPTWDCGYAAPTSRMQYTASSYAQPLTSIFAFLLRPRRGEPRLTEPFPTAASFVRTSSDPWHEKLYAPGFTAAARLLDRFRPLQGGMIQLYVLYITLTLLILLSWKLR